MMDVKAGEKILINGHEYICARGGTLEMAQPERIISIDLPESLVRQLQCSGIGLSYGEEAKLRDAARAGLERAAPVVVGGWAEGPFVPVECLESAGPNGEIERVFVSPATRGIGK